MKFLVPISVKKILFIFPQQYLTLTKTFSKRNPSLSCKQNIPAAPSLLSSDGRPTLTETNKQRQI